MKAKDGFKLLAAILLCQAVGIAGAFATTPNLEPWYASLTKPSFNPPSWVFGPVWTVLYLMMAVSVWLVERTGFHRPEVRKAVFVFAMQLFFNGIWSFLFFSMRSPLAGLLDIFVLWVFVGLTVVSFYKIHKLAGALLIPYGIWVSFAMVLNFALWRLNL